MNFFVCLAYFCLYAMDELTDVNTYFTMHFWIPILPIHVCYVFLLLIKLGMDKNVANRMANRRY